MMDDVRPPPIVIVVSAVVLCARSCSNIGSPLSAVVDAVIVVWRDANAVVIAMILSGSGRCSGVVR